MATIPEAFAIAIEHHQNGRLQAAEQIYRQILAVDLNHADATHLLGVIAHQVGKLDEALACYRRALAMNPNCAEAYNNLGIALKDQGKLDEAIACWRRALEIKPNYPAAYNNLGVALRHQGSLDEAIVCWRQALALKPDYTDAHNNLGVALKDQGKLDEAIDSYRRAVELNPNYAEAYNNLGVVAKDQGKLDEAVDCYRRAVGLNPKYGDAHYNLGNALKDQGKLEEAIGCWRRTLELNPNHADALCNLGVILKDQGKANEAIAYWRRALELKPDFAEALSNLGNALKDEGKLEEAFAAYRRALELKPDYAEAHNNLGIALEEIGDLRAAEESFRAALRYDGRFTVPHYKLADLLGAELPETDLAAQRRLLKEVGLTNSQRLWLHFGLAQVLDARGEYAEAAEHLEQGNAMQLAEWRESGREYDPKDYESLVTRIIVVCTPEFFERVHGFGLETETPVFVVGLPRSGTTLIEQILASHSRVFGAGETNLVGETMAAIGNHGGDMIEGLRQLNHETAQRFASGHLEKLRALDAGALRIVDKMPENYLYLGPLASLFPRAKFIHCRRNLRDVAVSCWMTHFREVRWANDRRHIASRFHEYQRMMEHWRNVLPVSLLEVDYEETVSDLEGVARRIVAWCGLPWEPNCLEFQRGRRLVRTASAVQVRQPIFTTSVRRWEHYEHNLISLFAELESTDACGLASR